MTAMSKVSALCVCAATFAAGAVARAQMDPPRFEPPAQSAAPVPPTAPTTRPPMTTPPPPPRQPAAARAQAPKAPAGDDDPIDDPKVFRRLGTRIDVPAPKPTPPVPSVPALVAPVPTPVGTAPIATPTSAPGPAPGAPPPPNEVEGGGVAAIERPYTPVVEAPFEPTLPRLKLGLRRFNFVRIGASNSADGVAAPETFNNLSVDVYPVSRTIRVGLSSAFGWQDGTWLANGDYLATQTLSIGAQYRELGRIVPFAEGFAGVGYMRRLQFDRTVPTAFWQFGADAGLEVYVARAGYLSFALGYLRPVNGFAKRQEFTSVFVDTWSFKIGIGI
jgi:hypothetical protein